MNHQPDDESGRFVAFATSIALPIVLLVALGFVATWTLRVRPVGTRKVVLVHAFSGPLHDQGYDALAAVQMAIERSTDARGLRAGRRIELVAFDDAGTTDGAARQLEAAGTDRDVLGVLCCSTPAVSAASSQAFASASPSASIVFPTASTTTLAGSAVAAVLRGVRADRSVLIQTGNGRSDAFGEAVLARAHPTDVVDLDLSSGGSWERASGLVLAANPDAVFVDADTATASLVVGRLRDAGYAGPVAGSEDLGCSEMVTWTGPRLGTMVVPVRTRLTSGDAFAQRFAAARGHAPSDADRLFYAATSSVLAGSAATSPAPDSGDAWAPAILAPGEFPPRVLAVP